MHHIAVSVLKNSYASKQYESAKKLPHIMTNNVSDLSDESWPLHFLHILSVFNILF